MISLAVGASALGLNPVPPAQAQSGGASGPQVETFSLPNGLEVVVIPDHRAPVVTHMIWYKVGAADEPIGKAGVAHFLEHLMFKGTKAHPAGMFSAEVSALGGQENAFTSYDYTAYYQRVPVSALKTVMGFETDRMTGLILTDEVVNPERDVVLEERHSRTDSDPAEQLEEALSATLWLNHPYRTPVIGWEHEIRALNRKDAIEFYNRFYRPNNAVLVIAGDIDAAEVKALAEETYGKVPRGEEIGPRQRPAEPPPIAPRRITMQDARVHQPSIQRLYLAPSYVTGKGSEAYALDLLSVILGGGSTSRLYRALVVEQGIAASAGCYYWGSALDDSRFTLFAYPRPGVSLEKLEQAMDAEITKILKDGVTDAELNRARTRLLADAIYDRDNQASMARLFGAALTSGETVKDVLAWPDRVRAVTAEDVLAAARHVLDLRRSVTGLLEAAPEARP